MPWPANYGGAIDVFFKLRALHSNGVKIILHCFEYGERTTQVTLDKYCEIVHYYKRTTGVQGLSLLRPYIVNSRKNSTLLKNLMVNEAPILFEGLHTCYYLNHPQLKNRKKYVRTHNVEHNYYKGLAQIETNWWKRMYYNFEAQLLTQYEVILKEAEIILAISEADVEHFSRINSTEWLPAFHGNDMVYSLTGVGDYCLYHGNLSVVENENAVIGLVVNVFSKLKYKTIITGAHPSERLKSLLNDFEHIQLVSNPSEDEMLELKRNAHVHVLYSAQDTGAKLKLIDSLSQGRFVIANDNILIDELLRSSARRANEWAEYLDVIEDVFIETFTPSDISQREAVLQNAFSNKKNVEKLCNLIFVK